LQGGGPAPSPRAIAQGGPPRHSYSEEPFHAGLRILTAAEAERRRPEKRKEGVAGRQRRKRRRDMGEEMWSQPCSSPLCPRTYVTLGRSSEAEEEAVCGEPSVLTQV